jgi:hypothetical protein
MASFTTSSAQPRRKKPARLIALVLLPFLLIVAVAMSVAGGGAATATAACQVAGSGTAATPVSTGTAGAGGAITPLEVEQYWVGAGGPMSGAVTAAAIAYAESDDITDRLQGSSPSTPTVAGPGTPTDPSQVGWGLWQITPGSAADYSPTVNATIAVEKYRGNLAAGGNGWGPWTTYTNGAYRAGIPAAQAAYTRLTAKGATSTGTTVDVSNPLTSHAATAAPSGGATTAGSTTTGSTATAQISTTSADQYISGLKAHADAQYAIVDAKGTVLAQHEDGATVALGQSADAMLLLAYLRAHPAGAPTGAAASHLKAMIEQSSPPATTWVYGRVGAGAIAGVASAAHMTAFHLGSGSGARALGRSTATAKDLALLMANVDTLMPAAVRSYGMKLLANASDNQWGLLDANISNVNASTAGGVLAGSTWTVSQAAQVKTDQNGLVGIAVTTTKNQSQSDGQDVIQTLGLDLLGAQATLPATNLDLSGLSANDRAALNDAATQMQGTGACPCPTSSDTTAGSIPTSPIPGGTVGANEFAAPLKLEAGKTYEVGATQYGGPKPSSSSYGSIGGSQGYLPSYPDTFAELSVLSSNPANGGTFTFQDGNALNALPYMTGLRVTSGTKQKILYKRDIGYGQGPGQTISNGQPYRLDVWWQSAQALNVSKGPVKIELAPSSGTSGTLAQNPDPAPSQAPCPTSTESLGGVQLTPGETAQILPDGSASAPQDAPQAVKLAIAAANQIRTKPYSVYPDGHAVHYGPLSTPWPAYDCSGSTSYVLYKAGLHDVNAQVSGDLEHWGDPGPGKWISIYANSEHVFTVIAGRAFDTADYGGPNLPAGSGPRWRSNPLGNLQDGLSYVVRHPPGL